jgi:nicotinate-nucleotide pyrophosphorylase (carboxylating)
MLPPAVLRLIELALDEDLGRGDVTSEALVDAEARAAGAVVAKETLCVSGLAVAEAVFRRVDAAVAVEARVMDGAEVESGAEVLRATGPARAILAAERTALNFLQRLSGVATLTRRYVAAVAGTSARITDTRKTTPGFRWLEKQAVRHGGGVNHRADLAAGVLIKDNHVALYGVRGALERARRSAPHTLRLEVELTRLDQIDEALAAGAQVILVDNMTTTQVAQAVRHIDGRAIVEASGGVTLQTVRALAETGVDVISVGRLTHSAPAVDLSLELEVLGDGRG